MNRLSAAWQHRPGRAGASTTAVDALWLLALMLYVLGGMTLVPFHGDESTLIMMSRDYHYQFIARDLSLVTYHAPPLDATEQHLRLLNGTVPKYLIGFGWHLSGFTVDDLNEQWLWGAGWDWNVENGHMPSDGLLRAARLPNALLTALSVPLLFLLARMWGGHWVAYPASLLFATHPAILLHGRRAYMEAPLLFFGLLTVLLAASWGRWLLRHPDYRRWPGIAWPGGAFGGVMAVAGLAVASKHSGAVIAAAAWLAGLGTGGLWLFVSEKVAGLWRAALLLIGNVVLSVVLTWMVFYVLNPAWWSTLGVTWWPDSVERAGEVLALRADLLNGQVSAFPEAVYPNFGARLVGLVGQLSVQPTAYYEVPAWADYIADSIATYQASPWTGIQYGTNGLTTLLGLSLLGLTGIGIVRLVLALRRGDALAITLAMWGGL
ncbi:MAG: phospholipid carrier-dependent glycosyltransferase, partial [Anaerolineae bacterium]|nr:phospholipid carrier-dependent glycosyltransferase [Anaerolineae bacterium]